METRKKIQTALLTLLQETPLKMLTVKEIAYEAEVGRRTFYTYFPSIENAAISCLKDAGEELRNDLLLQEKPGYEETAKVLLRHWQKNRTLFKIMHSHTELDLFTLFTEMIGILDEITDRKTVHAGLNEKGYLDTFTFGGFYNLFLRWVTEETSPDENKIAQFISQYVRLMDEAVNKNE